MSAAAPWRRMVQPVSNLHPSNSLFRRDQEATYKFLGRESHCLLAVVFGELIDDPAQRRRGRTVDLLFTSVAAHAGVRMIGVVLSGSLDDGSRAQAHLELAGPNHPHQRFPSRFL
jgi:hypothetical protein